MQFKITASPGNRTTLNIAIRASNQSRAAIKRGLWLSGLDLAGSGSNHSGTIKQKMLNGIKTGRTYDGIRASAPGQSPTVRTKKLLRSVYKKPNGYNQIIIGANTRYADILENGSKDGKIKRRNYLKRPIIEARGKIITNLTSELSKLLK